jgi:hypothetical protein
VPTFRWNPAANAARYFVQVVRSTPGGQPDTGVIFSSPAVAALSTEWRSFFEPFDRGKLYFWRVRAESEDASSVRFSDGDWSPFTINDLTEFDLLTPVNNATSVSYTPRLTWQTQPAATHYLVYLLVDGLGIIGPFETQGNVGSFEFNETLHLNGQRLYFWAVEAVSPTSRQFSRQTYSFTTTTRPFADSGDVLDQLLGKQLMGFDERRSVLGIGNEDKPMDVGSYVFLRQFE